MICAHDTDVTENSYDDRSWKVSHKKKMYVTLSFNLAKVRYPFILYFASGPKALN